MHVDVDDAFAVDAGETVAVGEAVAVALKTAKVLSFAVPAKCLLFLMVTPPS